MYPLTFPTRYAAMYQQEVIDALKEHPPEAILLSTSPCSWLVQPSTPELFIPFLENLLITDYHPIGGYIRYNGQGFWLDSLESFPQDRTTLILYKRNDRKPIEQGPEGDGPESYREPRHNRRGYGENSDHDNGPQ